MLGELTVTIKKTHSSNTELLRGEVFTEGKSYDVIHAMEIQGELTFLLITNNRNFMYLSVNRVDPVSYVPMYEHLKGTKINVIKNATKEESKSK
jgi:hypothetical protein